MPIQRLRRSVLHLAPTQPRGEKCKKIRRILRQRRVAAGDLSSLRGKLVHLSHNMEGRLGGSVTGHLGVAISAGGGVFAEEARLELQWVLALLERQPCKVVSLVPCRESVVLISDDC